MPSQRSSLMQPIPEETRKTPSAAAEDKRWSRPECQLWTGMLLLGTCLLYCTRVTMPVCTVAMSQDFGWNKKEAALEVRRSFCCQPLPGASSLSPHHCLLTLAAATWP